MQDRRWRSQCTLGEHRGHFITCSLLELISKESLLVWALTSESLKIIHIGQQKSNKCSFWLSQENLIIWWMFPPASPLWRWMWEGVVGGGGDLNIRSLSPHQPHLTCSHHTNNVRGRSDQLSGTPERPDRSQKCLICGVSSHSLFLI